ncbi:MAG: succinylglutamate-semialdehyde dehydrogenase [Verrucomicrobia bacterium]|nr:succinylglutamate-semialdehyde dehydrogenase [Verrucomicrobiota bacterium]
MFDHFIGGKWVPGKGEPLDSINPVTGKPVFEIKHGDADDVKAAFEAATAAFPRWAENTFEQRIEIARRFAAIVQSRRPEFLAAISGETGKPFWESSQEVDTVMKKVELSIEAYRQRTGYHVEQTGNTRSILSHTPHGVVAVLGPFNFPAHLPNGHIVPALIAGNSIVFKPSELTPNTGALMADCWRQAGLPAGCLNVVQGGAETAEFILQRQEIAGVFFTGSARTGIKIHQRFAGRPDVILALEMGGNNPLVVLDSTNVAVAARIIAVSAFISSGQRCTCSRRLILVDDDVLGELFHVTEGIVVGAPDQNPEPFMGPVINTAAASYVLKAQDDLIRQGAKVLVQCRPAAAGLPFLRPGLIEVTALPSPPDEEIFGPLLQVSKADSFESAISMANQTRFGLAAGLIGGNEKNFALFRRQVRAGIINWNRPTTGASSAAPFGGIGISGNHRPSAFYAADYCAYPVATMQSEDFSTTRFPGLP